MRTLESGDGEQRDLFPEATSRADRRTLNGKRRVMDGN